MFQNYTHPFGFRAEWEVRQHMILLHDACSVLDHNFLLISLQKFETERICEFHERNLIRRTRLKFSYSQVIRVGIGRSHIVAQGKTCNQVSYHVVLLSPLIIFPSSLVDSGPIVHHRVYKWIILIPHPY